MKGMPPSSGEDPKLTCGAQPAITGRSLNGRIIRVNSSVGDVGVPLEWSCRSRDWKGTNPFISAVPATEVAKRHAVAGSEDPELMVYAAAATALCDIAARRGHGLQRLRGRDVIALEYLVELVVGVFRWWCSRWSSRR